MKEEGEEKRKYLLNHYKSFSKNSFITFGGDFIPSMINNQPITSLEMLEYLEDLNINFGMFGNHEFDIGEKNLRKIIKKTKRIKWITTNILNKNTMKPIGNRIQILKIKNIKICFLSILTTNTTILNKSNSSTSFEWTSSSTSTSNILILNFKTILKKEIKLNSKRCDVFILLTHLNLKQDFEILKEFKKIKLILGAHDHFPYSIYKKNKLILKSGKNGKFISILDLKIEKKCDGGGTENKNKDDDDDDDNEDEDEEGYKDDDNGRYKETTIKMYPSWKLISNDLKFKNLKLSKKIKEFENKNCL